MTDKNFWHAPIRFHVSLLRKSTIR